jgi:two-component sensor histidine kinase
MKKKNEEYLYTRQYIKKIQFQGTSALYVNIIDITEQKKNESLLESSLEEKEILLKEIHHRVKNNLQIISSLIVLQEQYIRDERILNIFKDFQNRIKVMALIHQALYNSENLNNICLSKYIKNLVNNLFKAYSADSKKIKLQLNIEDIEFNLDKAISCGLIINELVSNSLKHAFSKNDEGKIIVKLKKIKKNRVLLDVYDNGSGFPENIDYKNSDTLGLKLITTITKQMDGKISIDKNDGTHVRISW